MPCVLSPLSNVNYVSVLVVADAAPPSLCSVWPRTSRCLPVLPRELGPGSALGWGLRGAWPGWGGLGRDQDPAAAPDRWPPVPQSTVVSIPVRPGAAEADSGPAPWPLGRWPPLARAVHTAVLTSQLFLEKVHVLLHHFFSYSKELLPVMGPWPSPEPAPGPCLPWKQSRRAFPAGVVWEMPRLSGAESSSGSTPGNRRAPRGCRGCQGCEGSGAAALPVL